MNYLERKKTKRKYQQKNIRKSVSFALEITPLKLSTLIILFGLSLAVYLKALAPTITSGDSPELITAAYNLGISHPPGYPFYLLLGKIFSFLPLGEIAFRLNFFSAFFMATNAVLISLLMFFFLPQNPSAWFIGLGAGFFFGFTSSAGSLGLISEVYPLFWLCLSLSFLALLLKNYYLAALLIGIGINGHYTFILIIPSLFFWVKKSFWQLKNLLIVIILAFLGLTFIFYLPLRAKENPLPNWGNPAAYQSLIAKITLSEWGKRPSIDRGKDLKEYFIQIIYLLKIYFKTFHIFLLFSLGGLILFFRENKYFAFGLVFISFTLLFSLAYISEYSSFLEAYMLGPKFLVPLFIITLISISRGILSSLSYAKNYRLIAVIAFCLVLATSAFTQRLRSWRTNFLAYDYGYNLLSSLPAKDYYLVSIGDASSFPLAYLKYVFRLSPQAAVTGSEIFPSSPLETKLPLYTTMQVDENNLPYPGYRLFFAEKKLKLISDWPSFYRLRGVAGAEKFFDMMSRFTLSKYYLFRSLLAFQCGWKVRGAKELTTASQLSYQVLGEHYNYGLLLKTYGQLEMAVGEFNYFLSGFPHVLPGYYQLGLIYEELGKKEKARESYYLIYEQNPYFADTAYRLARLYLQDADYQTALRLLSVQLNIKPTADIYHLLGIVYEELNQWSLSSANYQKALEINPKNPEIYYNYARLLQKMNDNNYSKIWQKYQELKAASTINPNS